MLLGSRTVHAATVRAVRSQERPYAVQCALAELMCPDPLHADTPLVGANNYYAYGKGFDAAAVIRDASTIADLVGDHVVRPFGVGDEGWAPGGAADGRIASPGPWDCSEPSVARIFTATDATLRADGVSRGRDPSEVTEYDHLFLVPQKQSCRHFQVRTSAVPPAPPTRPCSQPKGQTRGRNRLDRLLIRLAISRR